MLLIIIGAASFIEYLKSFNVPGQVCKFNSYGLYMRSHRVIFLPFTKSKGTQNVSRGIRLPEPQNKFHAPTKESFPDAFIILIPPLICFLSAKEREMLAASSLAKGETIQKQHAAAVGWMRTHSDNDFFSVSSFILPVSSNRCHRCHSFSFLKQYETHFITQ